MKTKLLKPNFRQGYAIISFFIVSMFLVPNQSKAFICDPISISGVRATCINSGVQYYHADYQYARKITWEITGGTIPILQNSDLPQGVTITETSNTKLVLEVVNGGINDPDFPSNINVTWNTSGYINFKIEGSGLLGVCGTRTSTVNVSVSNPISNFTLSSTSGNNLNCNQSAVIQGATSLAAATYAWGSNGANIASNWSTGVYIDQFLTNGLVTILSTISNACGTKSASINLNITQPSAGNVTQNGTPVGNVIPNCQGDFWLSMPDWISANAIYTWELPGNYNSQTGEYTKNILSGNNLRNISENLQQGALVDFTGKVTVTGICGPPQIKTFVVKALQSPTIDNQIVSCSNVISISAQNPNGTSCNWWSQNGGTFSATSCQSAIFTAPGIGEYIINLGTNGPGGCYNQLTTTVKIQGTSSSGLTAGWASGVLSDIRERPGSNIAVVGGKVYFAGRDGKLNYYYFDNATDKWIMGTLPGVTNAKIPATGAFTKIATTTEGAVNYLYYVDNTNILNKINLLSYFVSNPISYGFPPIKDFIVNSTGVGFIYNLSNNNITSFSTNTNLDNTNPSSVSLKAAISTTELVYIKNNTLYSTLQGQLYSSGSYPSADVVYFNNNLYFTAGTLGFANLYHIDLTTLISEQITYSGNLTGIFSINPTTGTLYYGIKSPSPTLPTLGSGTFNRGELYQARLVSGVWAIIKTTSSSNYEGSDNFIYGPVFDGNHLFYVGAGGSSATGTQKEIEVWNLFYESACTPSVFRKGNVDENYTATSTETSTIAYPNPFDQELTFSVNTTEGEVLAELYNATGQLVVSKILTGTTNINTTELSSGLYTLLVKQNGKIIKREKLAHK